MLERLLSKREALSSNPSITLSSKNKNKQTNKKAEINKGRI
jgi:hypothetical protein